MPTFPLDQIRIGARNQLSGSDSLYDAFTKCNNNFATLANANFSTILNGSAGISLSTNPLTGVTTITNTGVTALVGGTGISLSANTGTITISTAGSGGVVSVTTTSTANAVVANVPTSVGGVKFFVSGVDNTSGNRYLSTLDVVTSGGNLVVSQYGNTAIGNAGVASAIISGSNIQLIVTPASVNNTLWTTQISVV